MANKASKHSETPLPGSSKDVKARSGAAITGMCLLSKPRQYYQGAGSGVRLKKVTFGDGEGWGPLSHIRKAAIYSKIAPCYEF